MARTGDRRVAYRVLVGRTEGREHLEDLGIDRRIIIKWILKNWFGEARTGFSWLRLGRGGGRL